MSVSVSLSSLKSKIAVVMVLIVLFFGIFGSYQRANAFVWALLAPAAAEAAYVGTMTAIFGGAALATAGIEYLDSHADTVEATARETWGLMSADMKDNFIQSMSQSADAVSVAGNFIEGFLSNLRSKDIDTPSGGVGGQISPNDYTFDNVTGVVKLQNGAKVAVRTPTGATYNLTSFQFVISRSWENLFVGLSIGDTYPYGSYATPESASSAMASLKSNFQISLSAVSSVGYSFNFSTATDLPTGNLDNILDNIRARYDGEKLRLGVPTNTMVEPWANTATGNARVYENADGSTDTMVLPDGTPIPRDQVNWRTRATGQATIDGVSVPVVVGADGSLYDVNTGERVATREDAKSIGIPVSPAIDREWAWQDTLTKNPAKEETKDDTTTKPADLSGFFAKLWDWLKKILDAILGLPAKLIALLKDLFILLFVPDIAVLLAEIDIVKKMFDEKFGILKTIKDVLTGAFSGGSSNPLNDVTLNLPILNEPLKINTSLMESSIPTLKKIISGVMVLFTFLYIYRKITGRGGVMEK